MLMKIRVNQRRVFITMKIRLRLALIPFFITTKKKLLLALVPVPVLVFITRKIAYCDSRDAIATITMKKGTASQGHRLISIAAEIYIYRRYIASLFRSYDFLPLPLLLTVPFFVVMIFLPLPLLLTVPFFVVIIFLPLPSLLTVPFFVVMIFFLPLPLLLTVPFFVVMIYWSLLLLLTVPFFVVIIICCRCYQYPDSLPCIRAKNCCQTRVVMAL
jgi:hypothetical protein